MGDFIPHAYASSFRIFFIIQNGITILPEPAKIGSVERILSRRAR